jgi:hypothetical protein
MTMMIIIGGVVLFVVGIGVLIFTPAPNTTNSNFSHLPGQSPIDKLLSDGSQNNTVQLPEIFNQADIVSKLYKLQNAPSVFDMYVMLLLNKFSADGQKRFILQEATKFEAGKKLIDANTELQRSLNEFNRLNVEDKVKRKEGDVKLAQLDADIAEAKLRKTTFNDQRKNIKQPPLAPNLQATSTNTEDLVFGEKQRKLEELQRKKQSQEQKINNDVSLSAQDRKERLDLLDATYQQEKLKLQVGFGGFEDD